jgi:uncharacterized protein YajQ (UPF0234 family)
MSSGEENNRIENGPRSAYDGKMDVRFIAIETRIAAMEVDVAVIRTSFATKDDVQRIIAMLHEQKLEFSNGFATQRGDFNSALANHREDFTAALTKQGEYFTAALAKQKEDFTAALAQQSEKLTAALAQQNERLMTALTQQGEKLTAAMAQQSERFDTALSKQRDDLYKILMSHIWKFYGFTVVLMSGVYYLARYVH